MKTARICFILVVAALTSAAWFESPESREREWKKDPWTAFRRTWYFHHFDYYPRESTETTMVRVHKNEIEQLVGRSEGKGKTVIEESRTFKYTVRETGSMEDGSPYVEITLTDIGAVWTVVLLPKEKKMKLFRGGIFGGIYSVDP